VSGGGTLELLAGALVRALAPLQQWMTPDAIVPLFGELGLQFPADLTSHSGFANAVSAVGTTAGQLAGVADTLANDIASDSPATAIIADGASIIAKVSTLISQLGDVETQLTSLANAFPGIAALDVANFAADLPMKIVEWMLVTAIEDLSSVTATTLALTGIIDRHLDPGSPGNPAKPSFEVRRLRLDRISDLVKSPVTYLQTLYDWGTPGFDGAFLFQQICEAAGFSGLPAVFTPSGGPGTPSADLLFLEFTPDTSVAPPGVRVDLRMPIQPNFHYTTSLQPGWNFDLAVNATLDSGLVGHIKPQTSFTLSPPSGSVSGDAHANVSAAPVAPATSLMILGIAGGTSLTANEISAGLGATLNWDGSEATVDPLVQFGVTGGKLVIDMSEADGFLSDVTSGTPIQATFALAATWAPDTGLHITGGAQLEIDLPLHLDLGPVTLDTIYVIGGIAPDGFTLDLAAALGVTLGPIQASVDKVGLSALVSFPQGGGNLGPANLALGFKPPDGLGLEIDAGPASGGGYISFDPSQGQYSGVLDVSLMDIVQVKVIGVIDTKMPDGSSGFSFILIITFDLPPIQLGFGFTLNGVGGLGGVNRTINTSALQAGFVAHSLNSILFPPNPIANAPEIISNLRSFFPVAEHSYVFGPMMEMGWGTPTLITLEIGVILELPDPVVIVLLGLVDVALPTADAALIQIHIDILGELDFGTKTLDVEGDMYDSSVLIYSMAGSLYFSVCWGSDPNFVYSVGGFNPHFNTAGLNIPPMQRCSVSIGAGDNPRISANNYFAVTSNSLQFGANVQAYASAAGFTIQGYLGFDVLVIFSPFSFEFDFTVSFSASFEGVNLCSLSVSGSFSGPRPWNLNGTASISILFWTVSASVNITWGDSTPVTIPQKAVLPDLVSALQAPSNWSAALPAGMTPAVSLAAPAPANPNILVYPMGTLSVRENVVPLDFTITMYGNATPSDGNLFAISDVHINSQEAAQQTFKEYFAPGQFNALNDADKLSAPSFELHDAGVTIGSSAVQSGQDSPRTMVYEEFYIDSPMSYSRSTGPYLMGADIYSALARQGAGFSSPVAQSGLGKYSAGLALGAISTAEQGYVIASTNDLSVRSDLASANGVTYFQARAALDTHLVASPADAGTLQIVTLYEAAA
jgi:uncharacterized protein DUF6603